MADELKDQRVVTMMSPRELDAIDEWMFANRIRSRGEAIRRLCQIGMVQKARDELLLRCLAEMQEKMPELIVAARVGGANKDTFAPVLSGTLKARYVLGNKAGTQSDLTSADIDDMRARIEFWDADLNELRKLFDLSSEDLIVALGKLENLHEGEPATELTLKIWDKFRKPSKGE
ncbi:MAG: hypothetical protein JNK47_12885 [Mesorhizobium sp.]|nr:hypothetical protein [Mesorhizobium sp.]MBL8578115.1 hypothetical protein [Mesorhizobium sp.]